MSGLSWQHIGHLSTINLNDTTLTKDIKQVVNLLIGQRVLHKQNANGAQQRFFLFAA